MGYAPGAADWFADCVLNYGPEKVYVVSYVQSRRLRELLVDFLFAQGGLLHAAGTPQGQPGLDKFQVRQTPALCPE